jgi:hypothetical protein
MKHAVITIGTNSGRLIKNSVKMRPFLSLILVVILIYPAGD